MRRTPRAVVLGMYSRFGTRRGSPNLLLDLELRRQQRSTRERQQSARGLLWLSRDAERHDREPSKKSNRKSTNVLSISNFGQVADAEPMPPAGPSRRKARAVPAPHEDVRMSRSMRARISFQSDVASVPSSTAAHLLSISSAH